MAENFIHHVAFFFCVGPLIKSLGNCDGSVTWTPIMLYLIQYVRREPERVSYPAVTESALFISYSPKKKKFVYLVYRSSNMPRLCGPQA